MDAKPHCEDVFPTVWHVPGVFRDPGDRSKADANPRAVDPLAAAPVSPWVPETGKCWSFHLMVRAQSVRQHTAWLPSHKPGAACTTHGCALTGSYFLAWIAEYWCFVFDRSPSIGRTGIIHCSNVKGITEVGSLGCEYRTRQHTNSSASSGV